MIRKFAFAATAALLVAGLSACSRSAEEPAPEENTLVSPEADTSSPLPEASPEPIPSVTVDNNETAEAPPEAPRGADEQMQDDASATGMTARASRGDDAAEEPAPVEQANGN